MYSNLVPGAVLENGFSSESNLQLRIMILQIQQCCPILDAWEEQIWSYQNPRCEPLALGTFLRPIKSRVIDIANAKKGRARSSQHFKCTRVCTRKSTIGHRRRSDEQCLLPWNTRDARNVRYFLFGVVAFQYVSWEKDVKNGKKCGQPPFLTLKNGTDQYNLLEP